MVLPLDEYENLLDTLEIMSDPTILEDVKQALKEFREGKAKDLEELRAELDAG